MTGEKGCSCLPARVSDLRLRLQEDTLAVELVSFLMDNNIYHGLNPHLVASPEQLAFMVAMDTDQVYVPCSDRIFFELMKKGHSAVIGREYARAWRAAMELLDSLDQGREYRASVRAFCAKRLKRAQDYHDLIPSRLVKRLTSCILSQDYTLEDPWRARKEQQNGALRARLEEDWLAGLLNLAPCQPAGATLEDVRNLVDLTITARLACLSVLSQAPAREQAERLGEHFASAEREMAALWPRVQGLRDRHSTILLLCDAEGNAYCDLMLARALVNQGHKVVYAVKDSFYYHAPTLEDVVKDPALHGLLRDAFVCRDKNLSKKELLRLLREWRLIVLSDGTRERLNLLRVSVAFSRAWKEADLVLAKGARLYETLFGTSHEFTRDIVCWQRAASGTGLEIAFRPHAASVHKFSDIARLADSIVDRMREAQSQGRPVIFYSCVIGSIPGQTKTAILLANTIVDDLQKRLPNACIINPAAHFVEGMDGDDLMYMWERVQRSGLINIWYFETADDIERGFRLLGKSVPREWMGKDATYSTGCTKEMQIALEEQAKNPEMQIRGPDPDTFFRRGEYGVGKYFDATLVRR